MKMGILVVAFPNSPLMADANSSYTLDDIIISPEIIVVDGFIEVPKGYGIGVEPNWIVIERYLVDTIVFE